MVQTPMLSTMTFKIAEVNIVKEVEPNIIGLIIVTLLCGIYITYSWKFGVYVNKVSSFFIYWDLNIHIFMFLPVCHFCKFLDSQKTTRWTVLLVVLKRLKCSWISKHTLEMLTQNAMVQTPMLSTMTFKIAEVNTVKEVEPNIIGLSRNLQKHKWLLPVNFNCQLSSNCSPFRSTWFHSRF
jgi:hypothetical protein